MITPTILLIGASGRLGLQIIRAAAASASKPAVHAFVRTPSKIPSEDAGSCASVIRGDALKSDDVTRALSESAADVVIVSIGVPESTKPTELRYQSAKALMDVIHPGSEFEHVKVLVVSSLGAGGTKIELGMGMGMMIGFVLRHVLKDHDNQEAEFKSRLEGQRGRLLIVRPTGLTDGKANGETVTFEPTARAPSSRIDRQDLAKWIVNEVCGGTKQFGEEISITGKK